MAPVDENVVTKRDERALTSPAVRMRTSQGVGHGPNG
jgi:hypothetical protein